MKRRPARKVRKAPAIDPAPAPKPARRREIDDADLTFLAEEGIAEESDARDPSEPPSDSGRRVPDRDESTEDAQATAHLVSRGVNNAARDQRRAARRR